MIITTAIIKGGAGKTTTAAALAQAAKQAGKRVLCIDLDGQGNLTTFLGGTQTKQGSYAMITEEATTASVQSTQQGIDLVAATADLALLQTGHGSALRLKKALEDLSAAYDLIVIDTPPSVGEATLNALCAADGLIIPLEADASSAHGLELALEVVANVKRANADLEIIGALITRYNGRSKVNQFLQGKIKETAAALGVPYLGEVRAGVAIKEAQLTQQNLYEYAPKSNPAQDYKTIFEKAGIL